MKKEEEKRTLLLPAELYEKLEERVKATGFGSVYEYVIFILEEALKGEGKEEKTLSKEEEEEVKKKLRALGYLE
jgi:Arc/MetJ-type ribon-helix-helix transcriptional regulator